MKEAPVIMTPRLCLRPVSQTPAEALVAALANYDVVRWLGNVTWPYGVEEARAFLRRPNHGATWHIWAGDALVGGISTQTDFGFWIARAHWGRGYGPEAGAAVIEAHFDRVDAERLNAKVLPDNERSIAALQRLGFQRAGMTTCDSASLGQTLDGLAFRLTRADWGLSRGRFASIADAAERRVGQ